MGKLVFGLGLLLCVAGGVIWVLAKTRIPIGKLPGDISFSKGGVSIYFPVVTCLVVSAILTGLLYFIQNLRK